MVYQSVTYQMTLANLNIGLLYNLYADRLLGLGLVPQSIYDMQDAFYPTVAQDYGVPLDTRNSRTKCMDPFSKTRSIY